jgi:hypothetical protein
MFMAGGGPPTMNIWDRIGTSLCHAVAPASAWPLLVGDGDEADGTSALPVWLKGGEG